MSYLDGVLELIDKYNPLDFKYGQSSFQHHIVADGDRADSFQPDAAYKDDDFEEDMIQLKQLTDPSEQEDISGQLRQVKPLTDPYEPEDRDARQVR